MRTLLASLIMSFGLTAPTFAHDTAAEDSLTEHRRNGNRVCRRAGINPEKRRAIRQAIRTFRQDTQELRRNLREARRDYRQAAITPDQTRDALATKAAALATARAEIQALRATTVAMINQEVFEADKLRPGLRCVNRIAKRMANRARRGGPNR